MVETNLRRPAQCGEHPKQSDTKRKHLDLDPTPIPHFAIFLPFSIQQSQPRATCPDKGRSWDRGGRAPLEGSGRPSLASSPPSSITTKEDEQRRRTKEQRKRKGRLWSAVRIRLTWKLRVDLSSVWDLEPPVRSTAVPSTKSWIDHFVSNRPPTGFPSCLDSKKALSLIRWNIKDLSGPWTNPNTGYFFLHQINWPLWFSWGHLKDTMKTSNKWIIVICPGPSEKLDR